MTGGSDGVGLLTVVGGGAGSCTLGSCTGWSALAGDIAGGATLGGCIGGGAAVGASDGCAGGMVVVVVGVSGGTSAGASVGSGLGVARLRSVAICCIASLVGLPACRYGSVGGGFCRICRMSCSD